ncbi:uncharacterized protein [Panulirus ornatus]|uniref:uncharacterized protein n=1 Tax=Panulirus ornatus TaxID=150431 RepID=UPI003A889977
MNQLCRVCGEPAAGFHFGAFTCEGCKSFFGRTYNNVSSLGDCKNGGRCVINKKNRTSCKACRLRKCLVVGMSKSGSRYGRRSNWFKIHCLLDESGSPPPPGTPTDLGSEAGSWGRCASEDESDTIDVCGTDAPHHSPRRTSPALSSPDSHASDSSIETTPRRPPSLSYLSLYPKLSVVPPSSGIYPGPPLSPLLLSSLPMAVSAYSNHPFDPYLHRTHEGAQSHLPKYYGSAYGSHNTQAFGSSPVTPTSPNINLSGSQSPPRSLIIPSKRHAEELLVLPPIKRIRQLAEKEPRLFSNPSVFTSTIQTPERFTSLKKRIMCQNRVEQMPSIDEKQRPSISEMERDGDSPMDLSVKTSDILSQRHLMEERTDTEDSVILDLSLKSRFADRSRTVGSHETQSDISWNNPAQGNGNGGITVPSSGREHSSQMSLSREEGPSSPPVENGSSSHNSSCCNNSYNSSTSLLSPI